jgi:NO-binding membrane sensor protein with MHYT domain
LCDAFRYLRERYSAEVIAVPMTATDSFAFGAANPIVAFAMAVIGAMFGLSCLVRARNTASPQYARRWLIFATITLSVVGIWLTHFIAVLGFDVPDSPIRYSVLETIASLLIVIAVVGVALQVIGPARPSVTRLLIGGALIGGGVSSMHYSGIAASHVDGFYSYDTRLVLASVLIAVVGSIIALALAVWTTSYVLVGTGALVFAIMVTSMHYTGMAALQVRLTSDGRVPTGVTAVDIVIPVTIGGILTLLAMLFAALGMMSDDSVALTPDRRVLDGNPMPSRPMEIRPTWHIPAQPPLPPRDPADADTTQFVTVTTLRGMIK